jgi:hypothetical protein
MGSEKYEYVDPRAATACGFVLFIVVVQVLILYLASRSTLVHLSFFGSLVIALGLGGFIFGVARIGIMDQRRSHDDDH